MAEPTALATKHDAGKPRMDLIDPYAIEQLARVLEFGARKYAPWNWAKGIEYSRMSGAALRHTFTFLGGEDLDRESGLPHLAHAMCNLMFLLSMTQRHPEFDDRCPVPPQSKLNPMGLTDADRRFFVHEVDMEETAIVPATQSLAVESALRMEVLCSTRELELEQVLLWVMGYDVKIAGLPDFGNTTQFGSGKFAWRKALGHKLETMGVKL